MKTSYLAKLLIGTTMCLACSTSFSQLPHQGFSKVSTNSFDVANTPWKIEPLKRERHNIVPARRLFDSAVGKKIVIRFTTNPKGKVITVSYVSKESTTAEEQLIEDAKLKTLAAKPVIYTRDGVKYSGTYTFIFTTEGELSLYFQTVSIYDMRIS